MEVSVKGRFTGVGSNATRAGLPVALEILCPSLIAAFQCLQHVQGAYGLGRNPYAICRLARRQTRLPLRRS
jgi:hypothetical protein